MLSAAWRGKLVRLLDLVLLFKRKLVGHFNIAMKKLLSKTWLFFISSGHHDSLVHHGRHLLFLRVIDVVVLRGA